MDLKVCYVLKRYPRLSETFIVNEIEELQRQGVKITILAQNDSGEDIVHEKVKALSIPIFYLPSVSSLSLKSWSIRHLERYSSKANDLGLDRLPGALSWRDYATWMQMAMAAPLMKSLGTNHIHAHFATWATTAASFLSGFTGIPFSFTAHAKDIYHESVDKKALAEKIEKARFVITVSDFNRQYLEELLRNEGRFGRVIRLYNGIDLDQFKSSGEEKETNLFVGVGRLIQKKGFEYLIKACHVLNERGRNFQCIIIGEGQERDTLKKMVVQFSLEQKVSFLGAQPQSEVKRILQKASLFVLPCIIGDDGNRDGLPTVLLEAAALEVPIISTKVTGIPEIITHGQNGFLVEEKNPAALAEAIENLIDSDSLQKKFIKSAMVKVRRDFNITENVRVLKGYFYSEINSDQFSKEGL
jgi:glycosyltransferase involved in cell wall biosynthesis